MSTPDINLYSFNGPGDNGKAIDWSNNDVVPDATIADTIKCSTGLTNFSLRIGRVTSGKEDCLDINNLCRGVSVTSELWTLRGTMGITAKGGSSNIYISGPMDGRGKECDVDLGNASDQSHAKVTGVQLNLWRVDSGAVRVRVLNSDMPYEVPGSGPYTYVFPWKWTPFRSMVVKIFMEWRRWRSAKNLVPNGPTT